MERVPVTFPVYYKFLMDVLVKYWEDIMKLDPYGLVLSAEVNHVLRPMKWFGRLPHTKMKHRQFSPGKFVTD